MSTRPAPSADNCPACHIPLPWTRDSAGAIQRTVGPGGIFPRETPTQARCDKCGITYEIHGAGLRVAPLIRRMR